MKNIGKTIVLFILVACLLSVSALAHSGRTDGAGGHYDRSTGEYHYHHGYPAHQHVNGVCPYETTRSSRSSSSSIPISSYAGSYEDDVDNSWIFFVSVGGAVVVAITIFSLHKKRRQKKERAVFLSEYQGKSLNEIAPPDILGAFIGEDGLPCSPGVGEWGPVYTVYVSGATSQVFHSQRRCRAAFCSPANLAKVSGRRPCKCCYGEDVPSLSWYYKQKDLLNKCRQYGVTPFTEQTDKTKKDI